MPYYYREIITFVLELAVASGIFAWFEKRREKFILRLGLSLVAVMGINLLYTFILYEVVRKSFSLFPYWHMSKYFFALALCVVGVYVSFDCKINRAIACSVGGYAVQNSVYYVGSLITKLLDIRLTGLWGTIIYYVIYAVVAFLYFLLVRKTRSKIATVMPDNILSDIFSVAVVCIVVVLSTYNVRETTYVSIIYAIVLDFALLFITLGIYRIFGYKSELVIYEQVLQAERRQHEISEETIQAINYKCHDMRHQIAALVLSDKNDNKQELLKDIESKINIYDTISNTGNDALDIVLMEKGLICDNNKIKFTYLVDGEAISFMDTLDVYSLFGNILENAIEGVKPVAEESRFINVDLKKHSGITAVHVENRCAEVPQFANGLPVSKRAAGGVHGFGVKSMKNIVEKYHGNILFYVENNMFNVDIMFAGR